MGVLYEQDGYAVAVSDVETGLTKIIGYYKDKTAAEKAGEKTAIGLMPTVIPVPLIIDQDDNLYEFRLVGKFVDVEEYKRKLMVERISDKLDEEELNFLKEYKIF